MDTNTFDIKLSCRNPLSQAKGNSSVDGWLTEEMLFYTFDADGFAHSFAQGYS
jgi:hypothetical protein